MGISFGERIGDRTRTQEEQLSAKRDALWSLVDKMDKFQVHMLISYNVGQMSAAWRYDAPIPISGIYDELIKEAKHILR